jgi:reactive intermediate/imine deaminase
MIELKSHAVMQALLLAAALSLGAAPAAAGEVEFHGFESDRPVPLSDAVRVDDLLFLSGKLGIVPGTMQLAEGGIQAETRQTLENIRTAVEKYGSSMERVVKCTVFLADIAEWAAMNEIYQQFFPQNPPARSALGVSGLALDARVEIECVAVIE